MNFITWPDQLAAAITICDENGIIIYMNEKSKTIFAKDGGAALIGASLFDCHPEPSRTKLKNLFHTRQPNAYTIEKDGVKKMIYQAPWFEGEKFKGLVEFSMEIPFELPHFVRG
ncbi:MAG: PAS domain-containing protein [Candidatus Zixiibacteriota bacterium]